MKAQRIFLPFKACLLFEALKYLKHSFQLYCVHVFVCVCVWGWVGGDCVHVCGGGGLRACMCVCVCNCVPYLCLVPYLFM